AHNTSVRVINNERSVSVFTFSGAIGCQKLGHPVPESNLVSDENSALPQQMQRNRPFSCHSAYLLLNARSVPFWRVTSYCSGVSCFCHSESVLTTLFSPTIPFLSPASVNSAIRTESDGMPAPCDAEPSSECAPPTNLRATSAGITA